MSETASAYQPQINAALLSSHEWSPPSLLVATPPAPEVNQALLLRVEVPNFHLIFGSEIKDLQTENEYLKVTARAPIYSGVVAVLVLKNRRIDDAGHLRTEEVALNFEVHDHTPKAHFVASSLYATLGLAGPIRIVLPDLMLDLEVHFKMALTAISTVLQERQTHFGLMVIERATGVQFQIPEFIPGEDMNEISFVYRAIVEREFDGLANLVTSFMPANQQFLAWANDPRSTQPNEFVFGPEPASRTILGQRIALGPQTLIIPDGVINNLEEARRELAKLDGESVPVEIRPLNRMGRYNLPQAPSLPNTPWEPTIEACINLENSLNERLVGQYNALAAATLADLSPEEVELVTTRPILEDEEGMADE